MENALLRWLQSKRLPMLEALEKMPFTVLITDDFGVIVFWNEGGVSQFGYSRDEVIGSNVMMLMPDRYVSEHVTAMKEVRDGIRSGDSAVIGKMVERNARKKDMTEFPVELAIARHEFDGLVAYIGIISDVSDAKRMEDAKLIETMLDTMNKEQERG